MAILRRFAAQNGRSIPEGTRLLGGLPTGGVHQGQQPQFQPGEGPGETEAQLQHQQQPQGSTSVSIDVQDKLDITVWQALRNSRLRICFVSLSFALCSLVLAYYGASFGLESFSGELVVPYLPSPLFHVFIRRALPGIQIPIRSMRGCFSNYKVPIFSSSL